jgi:hypothetical protein
MGFKSCELSNKNSRTAFLTCNITIKRDFNAIKNPIRKIKKGLQAAPNPSENRCNYLVFSTAGFPSSVFTSACLALAA